MVPRNTTPPDSTQPDGKWCRRQAPHTQTPHALSAVSHFHSFLTPLWLDLFFGGRSGWLVGFSEYLYTLLLEITFYRKRLTRDVHECTCGTEIAKTLSLFASQGPYCCPWSERVHIFLWLLIIVASHFYWLIPQRVNRMSLSCKISSQGINLLKLRACGTLTWQLLTWSHLEHKHIGGLSFKDIVQIVSLFTGDCEHLACCITALWCNRGSEYLLNIKMSGFVYIFTTLDSIFSDNWKWTHEKLFVTSWLSLAIRWFLLGLVVGTINQFRKPQMDTTISYCRIKTKVFVGRFK